MGGFAKEFKEFALKGNVVDMAIGIVIGGAFGKIVTSFVNDILMPPIGLLLCNNFADSKIILKEATTKIVDGAEQVVPAITLNWGSFIQTVVDFFIIALSIFMMIKAMNNMRKKKEKAPVEPVADPADIVLLKEIRDELRNKH